MLIDILMIVIGYLLGGISTGYYLVLLLCRDDVRNYGSGATGATNVGRILGTKGFLLTFLGDFFKGFLIPAIAIYLKLSDITVVLSVIAVVAGHIWPLQLGFRGGKGVAAAFGGIVVINPSLALVLFAITMGLFVLTRKFTLSGLLSILASPIIAFLMSPSANQVIGILILAIILLIAHRGNIAMILKEVSRR
ncbi:glycerol-3-phosphate acyltransferase [Desulfosporosinus shakirovi]|uniref:glycerol-3-phosphate acyltransferase n=1 Tax=Desulfosporosinus shakirovi TaxID=2885154 RepID=UPI001E500DC4|nr:glycerol-3-phosphate acyltransferase [Desulfosporosinus sp. SRJS8]MCB8814399.1 glycerol-3-phosphate acyltransferase [Desulfosporosinus sp. SRJS8]